MNSSQVGSVSPLNMPPFQDYRIIANCNDLLMHRRFEECLNICEGCLKEIKNRSEFPRAGDLKKSFCILTIQSLAELNRWQEVVPHVTQTYDGIEDCPEKIIQACILLHNEVQDYPTCSVLANIWLRNPSNSSRPDYLLVLNTYLFRVLLPLKQWKEMLATLSLCKDLDKANVESYKQQINSLKEQTELESIEVLPTETAQNACEKDQEREDTKPAMKDGHAFKSTYIRFKTFILQVIRWIRNKIPVPALELQRLQSIALFSVIVYLLITRETNDLYSLTPLSDLISGLRQLWQRMFAPFHIARID